MRQNQNGAPPPLEPIDAVIADSISAFARRVGISQSRIFELIASGDVRTSKVGRRTVVPVAEVKRIAAAIDAGAWPGAA